MAHHVEPMDVDCMESEFDNKENTFHHNNLCNNVIPCTEKGYEELDVSELNMKLRYSMTPASSPMSKSYIACLDSKMLETDDLQNPNNGNANLTRSLNSTITSNDSVIKSLKNSPLQSLPAEQCTDSNGNPSVLRQLDSTMIDNANITITYDNLSSPSSSSSALHTPEPFIPTKEMAKDGGSPIMRGLKSVLNMFRSSQSPIPLMEGDVTVKQECLSPAIESISKEGKLQAMASTPIAAHRTKDENSSKRSSPYKDSIVFNDDLEKELNWSDETTILFSDEKIPVHKLFFQQAKIIPRKSERNEVVSSNIEDNCNSTAEYMDVSFNESLIKDETVTVLQSDNIKCDESESEFLDCETTFSKNESHVEDRKQFEENNDQIANVTKDTLAIDNTPAVNSYALSDVTGISFTDGDYKNDTIEHTDHSDYSKETIELLSELEQFQENVSLKTKSLDVNIIPQENVSENKEVIEKPVETYEIAINNDIEKDQNEPTIGTIESHKNEFTITDEIEKQEQNTSTKEQHAEIIQYTHTDLLDASEIMIKNKISIETDSKNTNKECFEEKSVEIEPNQKNKNVVCDVTIDPIAEIGHEDQKVLQTTIAQDLNLLKEESQIANDKLVTKNSIEIVLSENLNVIQNDVLSSEISYIPESQKLPLEEISLDVPLSNGNCPERSLKMVPSETLNDTIPKETNVIILENPSDIPLPDEDDIEKEVIITDPETIFTETVSPKPLTPETLNVTNTLSELDVTEIMLGPSDAVAEDNTRNNSVISETLNTMLPETEKVHLSAVPDTINMESKIDITETTSETPLEMLHESKIENTVMMLKPSTMTLEIDSEMPPEALKLTASDSKSDSLGTIDKSFNKHMYENIPPPEVVPSLHSTFDVTHEHIGYDATQIVDDSLCVSTPNAPIVPDNFEKCQDNVQVEPIDITSSGSLSQIHDLPDVVHQAIVGVEDNVQNLIKTTDTVIVPKPDDLPVNSANTIVNLEPLQMKSVSTKANSDLKLESDSASRKTVTVQQNEMCTESQKNQSSNIHLTNLNEIQSDIISENIPASGERNDFNDQISSGQPTETVSNTPNVLNLSLEKPTADEEIIVSENNSPYVSLMVGVETVPEKVEEIFEAIDIKTNLSSPPITSKGYNFNFDEMDDPFATKTKIRMSPAPASPTKSIEMEIKKKNQPEVPKKEVVNRRKYQPPERKKPDIIKKKINTSYDASSASKRSTNKKETVIQNDKVKTIPNNGINCEMLQSFDTADVILENKESKCEDLPEKSEENILNNIQKSETNDENKSSIASNVAVSSDVKTTSSSEQSNYYSAGSSSTECSQSKNVFNLPEIDDMNFNPFATKSKMRQSPPPKLEIIAAKTKTSPNMSMVVSHQSDSNCIIINEAKPAAQLVEPIDAKDKMETELMEKDSFANIAITTSSSQVTDKENLTTQEIKSEDEDTIEGPFLEAEDAFDKMMDLDGDGGMMQINELPVEEAEDLEGREIFIDAEAFEFLLNQNNTNNVADSGKESLFLKFDPLFAKKISSDGVLSALSNIQKRQSTPTKPSRPSLRNEASPIAGPSNVNMTYEADHNISQENDDSVYVTMAKPMMVVTPAVNPAITPRNKSITPTRSNRHSITFTSPAIAVIDRLLSMSGNSSLVGQDTTMIHNRDQTEADLALIQLRELLAEKEISVYNLRSESKELKDRLAIMESQVRILEADGQDRLKKIKELNERVAEKTKINKNMAAVVEEYERTIASLIAEIEQDKKRNTEERNRLINERDEQTAHLASMEVSFSDLHSKYEKSKQIILSCKVNEDAYRKSIKDLEENLTKLQTNYEMLKQHATSKLNYANQELVKINRAHEAEVLKMNAMIKRKDLHITSLEETLAQKTKANEELTAICDELINKVG